MTPCSVFCVLCVLELYFKFQCSSIISVFVSVLLLLVSLYNFHFCSYLFSRMDFYEGILKSFRTESIMK
jgi:hypothetical protein